MLHASQKRIGLTVLAILFSLVVVVYAMAAHKVRNDIRESGRRQLRIVALDLESVPNKFETLPLTIALQPEVTQVLA
ncbi:MAG TPA: hypothetical protein VHK70_08320 [Burkholderiaceae bacterium]|jgi:two-component system C4-dicarboxylate transport sensor histidine kinase DctB|nr:hypothetical protein [Burkholderiaceae bacterium]